MSLSAVVVRYRRQILLTAAMAGVLCVIGAVRDPGRSSGIPATAAGAAVTVVAALLIGAVVAVASRWHAVAAFDVDEPARAFRTRRGAAPVLLGVVLLAVLAFVAGVGGRSWALGDHDGGWVAILVIFTVLGVPVAPLAWRGHGITLTPDGIRADRPTGHVQIPWTALSASQPALSVEHHLDLTVADPGQLTHRGLVRRPYRITFEEAAPAFVAAALRHYAAYPADRRAIGSDAGHQRLVGLLGLPTSTGAPPPSRRRVAALAAGAALTFFANVTLGTVVSETVGRHSLLGYASKVPSILLSMLSLGLTLEAVRGARARRNPPTP
jgi:hypothetical protein